MRKLTKAIIAVLCIVICMSVFFACDNDGFHQYTELKSDGEYHWYECPDDGAIKPDSKEAHKDENSDGKCDVCDYAMEIPHTHNYSELKSNSEYHWYECACGDQKPDFKVKHADENRDGECDICHKAVTVIDIKGVSFAIAGKDGKEDVSLNGVEVTIVDISDKNNSFKATIADDKFVSTEIIPLGEYTVSAEGYNSTTINITKDGIDAAVVVLNKIHTVANSVKIEEKDGVPTLIVEGMIPEIEGVKIGNVMLHFFDDGGKDHYYSNTSEYAGAYHFEMPITEIPVKNDNNNTPWCWFHIYPYAEENPTAESKPITTGSETDLARGSVEANYSVIYNDNSYTVQNEAQLVIQAKVLPKATVTSIAFDTTNGKAELVVKGTKLESVGDIKIHANANKVDNQETHFYGNNVSTEEGKFECRFDFADIVEQQLDDTPWCWFHIFTYNDANPSADKLANPDGRFDLERGDYVNVGDKAELNDITYEVVKSGDSKQLIVQPKAPAAKVTSIEIKTIESKPYLVVTGTTPAARETVKLHVGNDDNHYYSDAVATTAGGSFELKFDITQMTATGEYYCHIYPLAGDDNSDKNKVDLPRKGFVTAGTTFDIGDLRYTIVEKDWDQVVVNVSNVPKTAVTSIEFDTTGDVPALVIKGTVADGVPAIKLHAWHNGHLYWDNLSTEKNQMEFKVSVTDFAKVGDVAYIHTMTYDATAEEGKQYGSEVNVERGNLIAAGTHVEHNGIRYWVKADEGLQILPVTIDTTAQMDITSIVLDDTQGKLIVKGTVNSAVPCLVIHTDGNGRHYYGDKVAVAEAGEFTLTIDLTQITYGDTPWCFFHIYAYTDAEPEDMSNPPISQNLNNTSGIFFRAWQTFEHKGVKYEIIKDGDSEQVIIQPKKA